MAGRRGISKNMRHVQAERAQKDEYLKSEEYQAAGRRHIAWLEEHGFPQETIDAAKRRCKDPQIERVKTRKRRGKVVEIPELWQGIVTHAQTIRKRKSKDGGKRTKMKKKH